MSYKQKYLKYKKKYYDLKRIEQIGGANGSAKEVYDMMNFNMVGMALNYLEMKKFDVNETLNIPVRKYVETENGYMEQQTMEKTTLLKKAQEIKSSILIDKLKVLGAK